MKQIKGQLKNSTYKPIVLNWFMES